MPPRDYETTPVADKLNLGGIIQGLAQDLADLRANKISNNDAIARSLLAKQIFNGVRLYLLGSKFLEANAPAKPPAATALE